jgi:hypothetical protein
MDLALAARDTAANSVFDLPVARLHVIPTPTTPARCPPVDLRFFNSHWIGGAFVNEQA